MLLTISQTSKHPLPASWAGSARHVPGAGAELWATISPVLRQQSRSVLCSHQHFVQSSSWLCSALTDFSQTDVTPGGSALSHRAPSVTGSAAHMSFACYASTLKAHLHGSTLLLAVALLSCRPSGSPQVVLRACPAPPSLLCTL